MNLSILQTDIPRRSKSCQKCTTVFSQGDNYCSVLEQTIRLDFCYTCWSEVKLLPKSFFWKAIVPQKKDSIDSAQTKFADIIELLKEILEKNAAEALLLALYLVRKRALIFRKEHLVGDQLYALYEVNSTEEMIAVAKVPLSALDLTPLKLSIASKLNEIIAHSKKSLCA